MDDAACDPADSYFGTPAQQAMLRRGRAMFDLLRDDPRLTYYGRTVGIATLHDIDLLHRLCVLQGAAHIAAVEADDATGLKAQAEARGLSVTLFARWTGTQSALDAAQRIVATVALPGDVTMHVIDATSPGAHLAALAEVAATCGVLPPTGAVLRGVLRPGVGVVALDADGRGTSCAAAAHLHHPDHAELGAQAWWGMLATRTDRRGERLALVLGARAMIEMAARFGTQGFMTGIQRGNAASEAVCARLGLRDEGRVTVTAVDPGAIASGKLTS